MNLLDRFFAAVLPSYAAKRSHARLQLRMYEAAQSGRRGIIPALTGITPDAEDAAAGQSIAALADDLVKNDPWARRASDVIVNNTVGWGIDPSFPDGAAEAEAWPEWARSCDVQGRLNFGAVTRLVMKTIVETGMAFVRRHMTDDGLRLEVISGDRLDRHKGNYGIEVDAYGKPTAYYFTGFERIEPWGSYRILESERVDAKDVAHICLMKRPGQLLDVSWFAPVATRLRDLNKFEDATLMRQQVASCFAAFVTDLDGTSSLSLDTASPFTQLEPGMVTHLGAGQDVRFGNPPAPEGIEGFVQLQLRAVAAGLGITYEDLTGDYSQVNFSSARMSRLAHYANVNAWRWTMLVPQFCDVVYKWWSQERFARDPLADIVDKVEWTAPPMPMLEPDKEGQAYRRLIRTGVMTPNEAVRERGQNPSKHWAEYAQNFETLDSLGIVLDCDARKTTDQGQAQMEPTDVNND